MLTTKRYPHATVADIQGAPAATIDGRPVFLSMPMTRDAYCKIVRDSPAASQATVFAIHDPVFWPAYWKSGVPDLTQAVDEIDALLQQKSDALVMLQSHLPSPGWWLDQHPDEVDQFDVDVNRYEGYRGFRGASWGSDAWLDAVEGWLEIRFRALHRRYGGRIIGHGFGFGTGENNPIGACTNDGRWFCGDFSPAMHRYFRAWLQNRYGTDAALREAWSDPNVTLATASVPTRLERLQSDWFTFRNPRKAKVADYYLAIAERVEQIVIRISETVKRATDGHCLTCSPLGGFMDNGFHGFIYHQASINSIRRALNHPAVDMLSSPASYENKVPGGDANSMMPVGSYILHNTLIFQDQDTRTSVLPPGYREGYTLGAIAADLRESVHVLKRDVAHAVIRGYGGLVWNAQARGMYDHPEINACMARLGDIAQKSLRFPRGIAEGVAIIVDEESVFHQQCANRLFYSMLYYQRQYYWNRSGVAWNTFLHNDLAHPRLPDHKLYYFLNTFYLEDRELEEIERKVKRGGATVIWTYAPGIQSPAGLSLQRVERLTGFRLKSADVEALPRITFTNLRHPYVRYCPPGGGHQYDHGAAQPGFIGTGPLGNDERERILGPLIYVDDPEATVLGELDALQAPGFCVKQMDGWTSVFCAAPMLNQYVLRNIARAASLHVYSDGDDVLLPGQSFLMLHARTAGEKVVRLPAPADVYECYDGRLLGRQLTEFRDTLDRYGTGFYFLGNVDEYLHDEPSRSNR
jgi:hypothetical protein